MTTFGADVAFSGSGTAHLSDGQGGRGLVLCVPTFNGSSTFECLCSFVPDKNWSNQIKNPAKAYEWAKIIGK